MGSSTVHLFVAYVETILRVLIAGIFYNLSQSSVDDPGAE